MEHDELRALAAAAGAAGPTWEARAADAVDVDATHYIGRRGLNGDHFSLCAHDETAAYIAAVSPDVVVGLLDEIAELRAAHAQAVDELRLWGAATVTQSDTGHGRARLGGAA